MKYDGASPLHARQARLKLDRLIAEQKYFKLLCNKELFVREADDKYLGRIKYLRSSSDLDSAEFSLTIERFRNFASAQGVYIPASDEYKLLELAEIEIDKNKEFV